MKILIVGGTGLIGGHAALHLQSLGHEITIAARNPPPAATPAHSDQSRSTTSNAAV